MIEPIAADWPAPAGVRAWTTTRAGGVSRGPWRGLNLALHVGDDPAAVAENRRRAAAAMALPGRPHWLRQVHGTRVVTAGDGETCADACVSDRGGVVCAVMTADCLPVLLCNVAGTRVGAAHAGWRGLLAGVLEQTVAAFADSAADLLAWLGPAIGPDAFEVGDDVRDAFLAADPSAAAHFRPSGTGRWLADLYGLARQRLRRAGVDRVYGGGLCTLGDPGRFFSYRRDGRTGRMASLIWLQG